MAKQTKDVREKKGFVLYADDLVAAEELLPDFERRGQLLSMITAYTTGNKLPQVPDLVRASFVYIRNGINANNAKYERKREKQAEYNQRQREKLERLSELERAKKSQVPQVPQVEQISQTAQTTINNSINNGNGNSNGIDNGNGINNGYGNRHGNSNGSENTVNSISPNTEYLKNNSISENKYTLPQVQEILERERIFFKQNWLRDFFHLNSIHYKWKFDPKSAALAYINLHPDALKEKRAEDTPPSSAAPPTGEVKKISEEYAKKLKEDGERIWAQLREELQAAVPPDKIKLLDAVQFAEAYTQGYGVWIVRLVTYTYNEYHDLQTNIFTGENWLEVSKKLRIKYVKFIQMADWKKERG